MSYGYAGNILRVNLSNGDISKVPTKYYANDFIGGRGIAAKIYWDEVSPEIDAFDPENRLIYVTGPVCSVPGFAGSRWQICGKSPQGNNFSYCNLGGAWGAQLKFAGYDALVVHGKADRLVYLCINNDKVEIKDASHLKGKHTINTRKSLKNELGKSFRVVAIGAAGENLVNFAIALADSDASGSAGLGAVMGSKNLKAIAVQGHNKIKVADPEKVKKLRKYVKELKGNFAFDMPMAPPEKLKKDICFGCINGCIRENYLGDNGENLGKFICQSAMFYGIRAQRYYKDPKDVPFRANKLCDEYGLDTRAVETMIMWLNRCNKAQILTEKDTGILFSKIGSLEFIENLLHQISFRQGFGDVLAQGTTKAAQIVGQGSEKHIKDYMISTGENNVYGPRLYLTTGLFYAIEPRMPIQQLHEISIQVILWAARELGMKDIYLTSDVLRKIGEKFWGSEIAADFSTYEGKALAAAMIQNRQYAKESLILCDFSWPIIHSPITKDHVGDPELESKVLNAITGTSYDQSGLNHIAERIFNLQRSILIMEGHQGREDDKIDDYNYSVPLKGDFGNPTNIVPGKNGEVLNRTGMVVDRKKFEKMKNEYYKIRGWDVKTGFQTKATMDKLNLSEQAVQLEKKGFLA